MHAQLVNLSCLCVLYFFREQECSRLRMEFIAVPGDNVRGNIEIFPCHVRLCIVGMSNHCYVFRTVICFFIVVLEF